MVLVTGDKHGDFLDIFLVVENFNLSKKDTIIILGDAGINFYLNHYDRKLKERLSKLPITLFMIHGNHECRPQNIDSYIKKKYWGAQVLYEEKYPNLLFAIDGNLYNIPNAFGGTSKTLVIGGAYSIDWRLRLEKGWHWFEDEQPSDKIKRRVEATLINNNWKVDTILSHTVPISMEPRDTFKYHIPENEIDKTTEMWLQFISDNTEYKHWYSGHYHINRLNGKLKILYDSFEELK